MSLTIFLSFTALIEDQDDEVLFAIAEELGKIIQFQNTDHCIFLALLQKLAGSDETVVREQATASLQGIVSVLNED